MTRDHFKKLLLISSVAFLGGCDDDWGDRAEHFVNTEVHGLSENYVKAHLPKVWLDALLAENMDAMVEIKAIAAQINSAKPSPIKDLGILDTSELVKRFNENDAALAIVNDAAVRLERLKATTSTQSSICDNRLFFNARGLGNIGLAGPISTLAPKLNDNKGNFAISITYGTGGSGDSNMWAAVGQFAASLFRAGKVREQNDKLEAAIQKIPEVVVQPDEAFTISQTICKTESAEMTELRAVRDSAMADLLPALEERSRTILLTQNLIASYLRPLEIKNFLSDSGVKRLFDSMQMDIADGGLGTELEKNLQDIRGLVESMQHTAGCIEKLSRVEELDDALVESIAEVRVFSTKANDNVLSSRLNAALSTLTKLHSAIPEVYKRVSAEECK